MTSPELALKVVELLGKASTQSNEFGRFLTDFTNATVRWIRPLFLIDGKEDKDFKDFKADPQNDDTKDIVLAKVKKALNSNSEMRQHLTELVNNIHSENSGATFINTVSGDKNIFFQGGTNTTTINNG